MARCLHVSLLLPALAAGFSQTGRQDLSFLGARRDARVNRSSTDAASFDEYIKQYGRDYVKGSDEYEDRRALFAQRLEEVRMQNSKPDRLWTAGINMLTDRTHSELARLRGYRQHKPSNSAMQFVSSSSSDFQLGVFPATFTWAGKLMATREILDQSSCGSCWATSSTTVLRARSELFRTYRKWSTQQIVSCTPNPMECGGQGGCSGATAELAFDYVARMGGSEERDWKYTHDEAPCPPSMKLPKPMDITLISGDQEHLLTVKHGGGAKHGMTGFRKLPENQLEPVLNALYTEGPVVVSIMAGSDWNSYENGIYNECPKDGVINHAVSLIGWGEQGPHKYWHIQNSWGPDWGEHGHIRMIRQPHHIERAYCGWDREPQIGSGCKGGPSAVYVCGSCGVLYDAVAPTFQLTPDGWWSKHPRPAPVKVPM